MEIHIADSIGKDLMTLVRCEEERMDDLKTTNDELDVSIDKMRGPLIEEGKGNILEKLANAHRKEVNNSHELDVDPEHDKKPAAKVRRTS